MTIETPPPTLNGLTELEKPGVLMSRMLHELTNCLSVLAGHVQLLEVIKAEPERLADSLKSIKWASDTIGEVVERYAGFRHQIPHGQRDCLLEDLEALLRKEPPIPAAGGAAGHRGWRLLAPTPDVVRLQLEPRWIHFAIGEMVRLTQAAEGQIEVYAPGDAFDRRGIKVTPVNFGKNGLVCIKISWHSPQPAMTEQDLFKPSTLSLALVVGIIRWVSGQSSYAFLAPDENRFWIMLPVVRTRESNSASAGLPDD